MQRSHNSRYTKTLLSWGKSRVPCSTSFLLWQAAEVDISFSRVFLFSWWSAVPALALCTKDNTAEQRAGISSHDDVSVFLLIVTKISLSNKCRERERERERKKVRKKRKGEREKERKTRWYELWGEEEGNLRLCHWLSPDEWSMPAQAFTVECVQVDHMCVSVWPSTSDEK